MFKIYIGLYVKYCHCWHIYKELYFSWWFSEVSAKTNFIDIHSVGDELLRKSDGRKEEHNEFKITYPNFW